MVTLAPPQPLVSSQKIGRHAVIPVTLWGPRKPKTAGYRHIILSLLLGTIVFPFAAFGILVIFSGGFTAKGLDNALVWMQASPGPTTIGGLLSLWLGLLTGVFLAGRLQQGGLKSLIGWGFKKVDLLIGLAFIVFVFIMSLIVGYIMQLFGINKADDVSNISNFTQATGIWMVFVFLGTTIIGPIVEEVFFRGLLLTVFSQKLNMVLSVVFSSLAFGLMHAQTSVQSTLYMVAVTSVLGAVFALMRLYTGRLGTSIVAHVFFNGANMTLALVTLAG